MQSILAGKPVIAPNIEPFSSILSEFHLGISFECEDSQSLAQALKKILSFDYSLYQKSRKTFLESQDSWEQFSAPLLIA